MICFPQQYKAREDRLSLLDVRSKVGDARNAASLEWRRREGVGRAGVVNEDREEMGLAEYGEEKRSRLSRCVNELSKEQSFQLR